MDTVLARNWWALALRGALAILLGLIAFLTPGLFLVWIALLFAAYLIVDGVFAIIAGLRAAQRHERWWPFALEGLVDIVAGIIVFLLPAAGALAFVYVVSAWSIITGLFRIAAAIRLRKQIRGEWLLVLNGILSVAFGIVIALAPLIGLVVIAWTIGIYAIVFGIILVALAFRLRRRPSASPVRAGAR
jgi:uncharacterized membrane protein HdeD (DUF308 family)